MHPGLTFRAHHHTLRNHFQTQRTLHLNFDGLTSKSIYGTESTFISDTTSIRAQRPAHGPKGIDLLVYNHSYETWTVEVVWVGRFKVSSQET